jgi:transposase-like protein
LWIEVGLMSVLAVGDGALGFWGAILEVFPEAREQHCWVHKIANVLDALPKSLWWRRGLEATHT